MRTQIQRDLEDKLIQDMQRVITHFFNMCDVVEISDREQFASVMFVFSSIFIDLAIAVGLQKDAVIEVFNIQWDRRAKKTEKNVTSS